MRRKLRKWRNEEEVEVMEECGGIGGMRRNWRDEEEVDE
jgi:hypothetical protein